MAKIDEFIPFVLHWETGVGGANLKKPLPELFAQAKKTGFANDPVDAGGATMCGVTLATYRRYRQNNGLMITRVEDLKKIPYEDWYEIIKTMFWDKWQADKIENQAVANLLVDWVWGSGVHGIKKPQALLGVEADGVVGPKTLAAVNASDSRKLFEQVHAARIKFVEGIVASKPSQAKFIKGWKNRINSITFDGLKM